jgi:hypothetical protein
MRASPTNAPGTRALSRSRAGRLATRHPGCWIGALARYTDEANRMREIIASEGPCGSVLVLDRDPLTQGGELLVAHLGADEPTSNAALVCERYLGDSRRGRCRRVTSEDLTREPYTTADAAPALTGDEVLRRELLDPRGEYVYRLELVRAGAIAQLRWGRRVHDERNESPRSVSLRKVVGSIESYQPARELTGAALARYRQDRKVVIGPLRDELTRLNDSPIVLNRRLRETVMARIEAGELSMGEIALRCGRAKRCRNGKLNGETSWLARRLGLLPESGASRPTPWVHSDVLALIARSGIGLSPAEAEL